MKLNYRRILLGGLLAGLAMNGVDGVVNGVLLGEQYRAILRQIHAEQLLGASTAFWVSMDFLYALAISYLGATMRPAFGTGMAPYVRAGIVVWLVSYLTVGWDIVVGTIPLGFHAVGAVATLVGFGAGAWIASRVYRERPNASA